MNLREFIDSPFKVHWIKEPGLSYYVRKSIFFDGSIELASCNAVGKNKFGLYRFLKRYERKIPFTMEQVLNDDLAKFMRQKKWLEWYIGPTPQYASPLFIDRYKDTKYFGSFTRDKGW